MSKKSMRKAAFFRNWLKEIQSTKAGKKQTDAAFKRMETKKFK